jgi:WD40 repeat protein
MILYIPFYFYPNKMKVIRINNSGTILFNQDSHSMTFYRIDGDMLHIIYRHTQQIPLQISVGEWSVSDLFFLIGGDLSGNIWKLVVNPTTAQQKFYPFVNIAEHKYAVMSISFHSSGLYVITACNQKMVLWTITNTEINPVHRIEQGEYGYICSIAFHPQNMMFVIGYYYRYFEKYAITTAVQKTQRSESHLSSILFLTFGTDGTILYSCCLEQICAQTTENLTRLFFINNRLLFPSLDKIVLQYQYLFHNGMNKFLILMNDTVFDFVIEFAFNDVQIKNLKKNEFRYPVFSYRGKICSIKDNQLKIEN